MVLILRSLALLIGLNLAACDQAAPPGATPGPEGALGAPSESVAAAPQPAPPDGATEIDWDALIPEDWQPETLMEGYDLDEIGDEDPRAGELMTKLKTLWAEAPVVPALDGQRIRIPGFVVPLDMEARAMSEFLLVPYYGACIHVPPPPVNQTIYVKLADGETFSGEMFDTLWVTGTLKVTPTQNEMADAGYRLDATAIAPYDGDVEPM